MEKNASFITIFLITLFISNACLAEANLTESCDLAKEMNSSQISENTKEIASEEDSSDNKQQKKELLPLDNIVSSILQVPGDAVKFVADIPYGEILWSTVEASAAVIEFIVDDGFFLGFFMGYYCCHN